MTLLDFQLTDPMYLVTRHAAYICNTFLIFCTDLLCFHFVKIKKYTNHLNFVIRTKKKWSTTLNLFVKVTSNKLIMKQKKKKQKQQKQKETNLKENLKIQQHQQKHKPNNYFNLNFFVFFVLNLQKIKYIYSLSFPIVFVLPSLRVYFYLENFNLRSMQAFVFLCFAFIFVCCRKV